MFLGVMLNRVKHLLCILLTSHARSRFFVATLLRMTHKRLGPESSNHGRFTSPLRYQDLFELRYESRTEIVQTGKRFRRRRPVDGRDFQIGLLGFRQKLSIA